MGGKEKKKKENQMNVSDVVSYFSTTLVAIWMFLLVLLRLNLIARINESCIFIAIFIQIETAQCRCFAILLDFNQQS